LKLQLRELVAPLSGQTPGSLTAEGAPPAEPSVWHDSSMELERGLDVIELSVDLRLCDAPALAEGATVKPRAITGFARGCTLYPRSFHLSRRVLF
jgi:hypothetical protein